ncbi:MAG: hypothetical protein HY825_08505 [Acidobacteria bacterium]|nr:hypothetical protein [Acidobacteriota bacterium]
MNRQHATTLLIATTLLAGLLTARPAAAHCDTLDGPVVVDARAALERGDVTPVLKWVQPADEAEIRAAFDRTVAVRGLSPEARALADTYFFETLVRVHRAGEGAPFTGLKPAGGEVDPGIAAADRALASGSVDALVKAMSAHVADGIGQRFARVVETGKHAAHGVAAGREYVAAYVDYVHYVERLHVAAVSTHAPHAAEAAAAHQH